MAGRYRAAVRLQTLELAVYRSLPRALQVRAVRWATPNTTLGVVGLLTRTGQELLLVRSTYRAGWVPPGGLLQRGETATDGLRRELHEELGLTVEPDPPHRASHDVVRQVVSFVSVVRLPAGAEPVPHRPELRDAAWFPLAALPPLAADFHEGVTAADLAAVRAVGG